MNTELQGAVNVLVKKVEQKAQELAEMKRLVNSLCHEAGQDLIYSDAETGATASGAGSIRSDQFYTKTPIVAAREYLEMRGKAVPLDEICQGLVQGGFDFAAQGWSDALRLRNLGISLGKNTAIFHRLPNDTIGLKKWYPGLKEKKPTAKEDQLTEPGTNGEVKPEMNAEAKGDSKTEPANNA